MTPFFVLALACLGFLYLDWRSSRDYQHMLVIKDETLQSQFREKLAELGVKFIRGKDGEVFYSESNRMRVENEFENFTGSLPFDTSSVTFRDTSKLQRFVDELREHGIDYEIKETDGRKEVLLGSSDKFRWESLLKNLE